MGTKNDMKTRLINIFSHVAGWLFFFSLILVFFSNSSDQGKTVLATIGAAPFLIFSLVYLSFFYCNYFLFVPQLFLTRKYLIYFSIIAILLAAVYVIKPFDRLIAMNPPPGKAPEIGNRPPPPSHNRSFIKGPGGKDINSIIIFITAWSLSTAIPAIRRWKTTEKRALQAETDRANAELSFLKSQVNPHFLFNTLNNIYSMAITKNENTAPSIMKLSNIMRYVTDEAAQDYVSLESEVACMHDYIDLQKLRLGSKMTVDYSITGLMEGKKIPPLLLMTFVENVFKYGISSHEQSSIIIRLSADEHTITFYCRNKLFETKRNPERTGIGLANAQKRLWHLYPNKHLLAIKDENNFFTVQLTLQA
jgi:two-component system, LytTR family, sensor kinase